MIHENISTLRKKRKLTQEALGESVGVSRQTVAKWESGESTPDLEAAGRLAAVLDVTLDDLTNAPMLPDAEADVPRGKYVFGLVTVGDKGQIVIPVRARRVFRINPGDQLLVLGDEGRGLALVDAKFFLKMAEDIKHGGK
ncbi:MAG: helix-turn-helix domain-containing protein [Clostridia bacterium]|nr:helix-turn-helix domain-containing protein [Clostridia bacterium]